MHVQISKEIKEKPSNVILSDESNSENSNSSSDNECAFVVLSDIVNGSTNMKKIVEISCNSDIDQTVIN